MNDAEGWDDTSPFGRNQPKDADAWIFHYTSLDGAAGIGLTQGLMLGHLQQVNDPRESKWRQVMTMTSGDGSGGGPRSVTTAERLAAERVLEERRLNLRVACFTRDSTAGFDGTAKRADSRGFALGPLWAHYADRHRGVCLVMDRRLVERTARELWGDRVLSLEVDYVQGFDDSQFRAEIVDCDRLDLDSHFRNNVMAVLGSKNAHWQGEREYRLVVMDEEEPACVLPLQGTVVGLALGVDFPADRTPVADSLCERLGLEDGVVQMWINNAVLDVAPARNRAGHLTRWSDDDLRAGAGFR